MEKCPLCKGRGMQIHIQQIGPGMVQQIQTVCIECKGQGERISPKDRCDSCSGSKVIREKKIIEVHVEKGEAAQLGAPPCSVCCWQLTVGRTGQASGTWSAARQTLVPLPRPPGFSAGPVTSQSLCCSWLLPGQKQPLLNEGFTVL